MAKVLRGDFGDGRGPIEPSGWHGYDDVPDKVHQYAFTGSNIHKIVVTTDVPAPSRAPRSTKSKPTPAPQEANIPASPNTTPAKERCEVTIPSTMEPAIRRVAEVGREELIDRPTELAEMVAALKLVAASQEWRSVLAALSNAERAQHPCAFVSRPLIELAQAGEDEAVKRLGWFAVRLKANPKAETSWYDKARGWIMPSLGDMVLDATTLKGRLVRWLARRTFNYNWDRAMLKRATVRANEAAKAQCQRGAA